MPCLGGYDNVRSTQNCVVKIEHAVRSVLPVVLASGICESEVAVEATVVRKVGQSRATQMPLQRTAKDC